MGTVLYRYMIKVIIGKFIVNLWYFARVIFVGIGKYGYLRSPTNPWYYCISEVFRHIYRYLYKGIGYGKMLAIKDSVAEL